MSSISMEFEGLKDLIKKVEQVADDKEITKANKKALAECSRMAKNELQNTLPRSKDPSKSGRKGSRTGEHSADNIPTKVKKNEAIVGWGKGDISPYYYTKFHEFGDSKHKPLFTFKKTFIKQRKKYDEAFKKEYEELIKALEE